MDPTLPVDNASVKTQVAANAVRNVPQTADTTSAEAQSARSGEPARVAESLQTAKRLVDSGRAEVEKVDNEKLMAIKKSIQNGSFFVNPPDLAEQLISDSFGEI